MTPVGVLELRDTYEIGGPGKTILETHRFIDRDRFRVHLGIFLTPGESADTPFTAAARDRGMPVHLIPGANRYDPRLASHTARLIQDLGVDIVHAHEVKSDVVGYLAARLARVAIVTTVHGWIGNTRKQRALIALDKRLVRRFDRVLAVSGRIEADLLAARVPSRIVRLLHNAIVTDQYRRRGGSDFRASLPRSMAAGPLLVSIGRLSHEKGHADLLDALAIIAGRGAEVSLALVGDGPERPSLEQRVHDRGLEGRVAFAGYVSRPQLVLEDADLMVLPSHTEGLPNAALEALAMEVPVLATAVGGTPEVVVDGVTGRLVPARDIGAMADAIGQFLADPTRWRAMAAAGAARVREQFDFDTRTRRLEAIYAEVVGR